MSDTPAPPDLDMRALTQAFELFTKTTQSMEESYRRLEERLQSLDQELQVRNHELALTTDYLNSILDSMSDGVIAVNTDGVITTFNRAAREILGYAPEDVLGKTFRAVFGHQFIVFPGRRSMELAARGGNAVPITERNAPIADRSNTRLGSVKVFQDVREIESLREQVRLKERLAAIGEMAATVAHEIRNPLGGIRGFATLLQRDTPAEDPRRRLIEKILTGTKNLDRVVTDLLEYTRPIEIRSRPLKCRELVDAAVAMLDTGGEVTVSNLVESSTAILGDPDRLRQVLLNILLNARQSIEGAGSIEIRSHDERDIVSLTIRDSGCGIPEEEIGRLFSPFFTTKVKGTGLGLAIAQKIIERHGGQVEVSSTVGQGSEFRIRLPKGDPAMQPALGAHS